jgi:hypothetical protein
VALAPFLTSIVSWLRAGYPDGVPEQDYMPLFALLASQLTHDELNAIADELADQADPPTAQVIRDAIGMVTHSEPSDADVANVRAHLAAGGWPLAQPQRTGRES